MKEIDYAVPRSVDEAVAILKEKGDRARVLAGGTDLIIQIREYQRDADFLVDIKAIPQTMELTFDSKAGLTLGAAVPCYRIYEDTTIRKTYPGIIDSASLIGGTQIQSRASFGGNLCNASPAADTIPTLIAHSAVCVIAGPDGTREVPVEQFCTAPGKTVLSPNEFLVSFKIPAPPANFGAAYLRFIPRNEMDIAVVGAGVSVTLDDAKSKVTAARIALAAVAPTPLLADAAGKALVGNEANNANIEKAAEAARAAAKPISDMRGDAEYRKHLAGVLTKRALKIAVQRAKS